jgi:hypothetical protein
LIGVEFVPYMWRAWWFICCGEFVCCGLRQ